FRRILGHVHGAERDDFLWLVVFRDREVRRGQAPHRAALLVEHGDVKMDEVDRRPEHGRFLALWRLLGGRRKRENSCKTAGRNCGWSEHSSSTPWEQATNSIGLSGCEGAKGEGATLLAVVLRLYALSDLRLELADCCALTEAAFPEPDDPFGVDHHIRGIRDDLQRAADVDAHDD